MAEQVTVSIIPKEPEPKPKPKFDAKTVQDAVNTAVVVGGLLSKLPLSDTMKGLLLKLFIFGFGVFCGIGIVYKSKLEPQSTPGANVSVYQKRIEELQKENANLKKLFEENQGPLPAPQLPNPAPFPTPKFDPNRPQPGFIVK